MIDWQKKVVAPNIKVFGESASFRQGNVSYSLSVVFDNAYREITLSEYAPEVNTVFPACGLNLADLPVTPKQGDQITVTRTGKVYAVREVRPDSHGWALLVLNYLSG